MARDHSQLAVLVIPHKKVRFEPKSHRGAAGCGSQAAAGVKKACFCARLAGLLRFSSYDSPSSVGRWVDAQLLRLEKDTVGTPSELRPSRRRKEACVRRSIQQ